MNTKSIAHEIADLLGNDAEPTAAYEVRTAHDGMGGGFVGGPITLSRHRTEGAAERACSRQRREGYRRAYAVRLIDGYVYAGGPSGSWYPDPLGTGRPW